MAGSMTASAQVCLANPSSPQEHILVKTNLISVPTVVLSPIHRSAESPGTLATLASDNGRAPSEVDRRSLFAELLLNFDCE